MFVFWILIILAIIGVAIFISGHFGEHIYDRTEKIYKNFTVDEDKEKEKN